MIAPTCCILRRRCTISPASSGVLNFRMSHTRMRPFWSPLATRFPSRLHASEVTRPWCRDTFFAWSFILAASFARMS